MRIRSFMVITSAGLLAASLSILACGGDSEDSTGDRDSNLVADGSAEASDAGSDVRADACDTPTDILATVPDASLADGSTSSGLCMACLDSKCSSVIDKCEQDCNCRAVVSDVLGCFSQKGDLMSCFTSTVEQPSAATQALGLSFLSCVSGPCEQACGSSAMGL